MFASASVPPALTLWTALDTAASLQYEPGREFGMKMVFYCTGVCVTSAVVSSALGRAQVNELLRRIFEHR